jgi:hypothetical protein
MAIYRDSPSQPPTTSTREPLSRGLRRLRFSLRSLMIVVTLVCAAAGLASNQANRQRRAIERIQAAHGTVYYDYQMDAKIAPLHDDPPPPGPIWLRNVIGVHYFATATAVTVNVASDEFLSAAGELPHLKALRIFCDSKITDDGLAHLKRLTELQSLYLRGVHDKGMSNLSSMTRLQALFVTQTDIGDAGLAPLESLRQLRELHLWRTHITDAGLAHLKGLTQLQKLELSETEVTDGGVKDLRKSLPNCKIRR